MISAACVCFYRDENVQKPPDFLCFEPKAASATAFKAAALKA